MPEITKERILRKELDILTKRLIVFENTMDIIMKRASSYDGGREIAKWMNNLSLWNQSAMHYGLGYSFRKIKKLLISPTPDCEFKKETPDA